MRNSTKRSGVASASSRSITSMASSSRWARCSSRAEDSYLYAPNFTDVIIRRPGSWEVADVGEEGVIQVVSLLPRSYPGHSVLTEDLGTIMSVDSGVGGRLGKALRISGRVPKAELRGCSDVLGAQAA